MPTYSQLLNRLCPFENRYGKYTIHSVLIEIRGEKEEYYAWALRSDKGKIDNSAFLMPEFTPEEFEQLKKELEQLKTPFTILSK